MNNTKPWWASKTIWGVVIASLIGILRAVGVPLVMSDADSAQVVAHVLDIVTAVAGLVAIYGRVVAESKIGPRK